MAYVLLLENFHQFRMRARALARQMVTPEHVTVNLSGLLRSNLAREGNQRRLSMRSVKHHWSHPEKKEQNEGKHNEARTRKKLDTGGGLHPCCGTIKSQQPVGQDWKFCSVELNLESK